MDQTPAEYIKGNTTQTAFNREVIDEYFNFIGNADSVIDIGCGTGETSAYIEERFGCNVTVTDVKFEMVRYCTEKYKGTFMNACVLDIQSKDVKKDFPKSSFTVVTSFMVLHWIRDLGTALENVNWLLKDGGKAAITLPTLTGSTGYYKGLLEDIMSNSLWSQWIHVKKLTRIKTPWQLALIDQSASVETPWLYDIALLKTMMEQRGFSTILYEVKLYQFPLDEANFRAVSPLINCVPRERQEDLVCHMVGFAENIKKKEAIDGQLADELPIIIMLAQKTKDIN